MSFDEFSRAIGTVFNVILFILLADTLAQLSKMCKAIVKRLEQ